ncbi:MAG: T9SS type A sorting domain-containing protein, partial [Flavobacteriales bacterium]
IVDVNGDELPDMIVANDEYYNGLGDKPSQLAYYENVGTATEPAFNLVDANFANIPAFQLENIHPAFGDLDGDGDLDMVLGEEQGVMHYFQNNAGVGAVMDLQLSVPAMVDASLTTIDVGQYATPQLYDVDGDGLLDILSGEKNGTLTLFLNTGSLTEYEFTIFEGDFGINFGDVVANNQLGINGFSVPFLYEEDEELNLLVGNELGEVQWFNGISGNLNGAFNEVESIFQGIENSNFAACAYEDLNGDSIRDYIQGNNRGGLILYIGDRADVVEVQDITSSQVRIAPNPNNGIFEVWFDQPIKGSIEVYDLQGRIVHQSENLHSDRKQLNLDIKAGLYSVVLTQDKQRKYLGKIIIE